MSVLPKIWGVLGMDARMFPSQALSDLEESIKKADAGTHPVMKRGDDTYKKIKTEIEARKNGSSIPKVTPQVGWGKDAMDDLKNLSSSQLSSALGKNIKSSQFLDMPNERKAKYRVEAETGKPGSGEFRTMTAYVWKDNGGSLRGAF